MSYTFLLSRVAQAQSRASHEIATAHAAQKVCIQELEKVREEFREYKNQKIEEIKVLHNRIKKVYGVGASAPSNPAKKR